MSHKFDGTWDYYKIAQIGFPPSAPHQGGDFNLSINDGGIVDPSRSNVDGRAVQSGRATATTIDVIAVDGRHYHGHLAKEIIVSSRSVLVIAGRYRGPAESSKAKGKKATPLAQDEGTWVIVK